MRSRTTWRIALVGLAVSLLGNVPGGASHGNQASPRLTTHATDPPLLYAERLTDSFMEMIPHGQSVEDVQLGLLAPPLAEVEVPDAEDAKLLLVLAAFNSTFRLVLERDNGMLIRKDAVWTEYVDGVPRRRQLKSKVFKGKVFRTHTEESLTWGVHPNNFLDHMVGSHLGVAGQRVDSGLETEEVGNAVIVLSEDSAKVRSRFRIGARSFRTVIPAYHGHFTGQGDVHHVVELAGYRSAKGQQDAEPSLPKGRAGLFDRDSEREVISTVEEGTSLVIWRESDRRPVGNSLVARSETERNRCGFDHPSDSTDLLAKAGKEALHRRLVDEFGDSYHTSSLYKRSAALGCPTQLGQSMLYMTAVADCNYVARHGGATQARNAIINTWSKVSTIYENNFNIYVGLIEVIVMPTCATGNGTLDFNQGCSAGYAITRRLSDFSAWRGAQTSNTSQISGLFHLMTTCSTGAQVGIAWLNTLCQKTSFSQADANYRQLHVSGTGVSAIVGAGIQDESKVVSHEIGHNFGAIHDCTANSCPVSGSSCCSCESDFACDCQERFLMNPFGGS